MNKHVKLISPVVLATLSTLSFQVHAAGTAAGTEVTNTAILNYQINGVDQDAVEAQDVFNVDIKVDYALTRLLTTEPNQTSLEADNVTIAAVQITNDGNSPTSFTVAAGNETGTTLDVNGTTYTDNIDTGTTYSYYVDDPVNGTPGVLDAADTLLTGPTAEVLADETITVFITVPKAEIDGADKDVALTTVTVNGVASTIDGTTYQLDTGDNDPTNGSEDDAAIANGATTIEVVYADTDADNQEILTDVLLLVFPNLDGLGNLTKTSAVISDPLNGTDNPKAIPGAVVEYTITLTNTGTADATNVVVTDAIPADTTYVADSLLVAMDGATTPVAVDAAIASYDSGTDTVTVNLGTVDGDADPANQETNVITFQVTID
ncbi:DUF11 domain-containing protein [Thalassolituus sp.]|uniref:DUF11 domain-containing protein n=1 Tax=Thalassolituus sp. TaxID=2030822 RepID=UPI0024382ED2|nr:DUF11 domain-containing protein [Thalassolituus sp.]